MQVCDAGASVFKVSHAVLQTQTHTDIATNHVCVEASSQRAYTAVNLGGRKCYFALSSHLFGCLMISLLNLGSQLTIACLSWHVVFFDAGI